MPRDSWCSSAAAIIRCVLVGRGGGHPLQHQAHGPSRASTPVGCAAGAAADLAAGRWRRVPVMPAGSSAAAVAGDDVRAGPHQHHRPIGDHARPGRARVGAASFGEPRLVVAAAVEPRAGRQASRVRLAHARPDRPRLDRAPHVEQRRQQVADLPDVGVRVDEAGQERPPARSTTRVAGAAEVDDVTLVVADGDDAVAAHGERGGIGPPVESGPRACRCGRSSRLRSSHDAAAARARLRFRHYGQRRCSTTASPSRS